MSVSDGVVIVVQCGDGCVMGDEFVGLHDEVCARECKKHGDCATFYASVDNTPQPDFIQSFLIYQEARVRDLNRLHDRASMSKIQQPQSASPGQSMTSL